MFSSNSRIPFITAASAIVFLAGTPASAFTIQVKDYECQDRSIMADFTNFCENNNTCTFGETAYVSGILNMTNDVSNSWGVSEDTIVYLDSSLHIATFQTQLLSMQPIYLCQNDYLVDYDYDAAADNGRELYYGNAYNFGNYNSGTKNNCPSAGLYSFDSVAMQLPSVPNKVYDWAATGWTGSVSIDMYLDSSKYQLIGRCQLNLVTHMDGSANNNSTNIMSTVMGAVPEAGVTGMIVLGTFVALAFMGLVGYSMTRGNLAEEDLNFKAMPKVEVA